ncbi:hypothetical protein TNCV_332001 [Trichonephila clavipes]|nr:hypothetical protein TNCV_332001 [Trichonephila clavipes]
MCYVKKFWQDLLQSRKLVVCKKIIYAPGDVPGNRAEWSAGYNMQFHTQSTCQPVPRLNFSFCYLRKQIANDDFQQDRCLRSLPFSSCYPKIAWKNIPEIKELCSAAVRPTRRLLVVVLNTCFGKTFQ